MSNFKCFKYRSINKNFIDSLVNSTLYFAARDQLNDPFDSRIEMHQIITALLAGDLDKEVRGILEIISSTDDFFRNFENGYKKFGICSLSIELRNTLMWSHYADEHRGVVLSYDIPSEFLDNPSEILGVAPVTYKQNAISDWLRENVIDFEKDHFTFVTELLKKVITAKAPDWGYEQEGRIIRPVVGPYKIPRTMLKGVTFGLCTNGADEKLVRSLAENYYEGIQFSRIVRSGGDYGIDVQEIK